MELFRPSEPMKNDGSRFFRFESLREDQDTDSEPSTIVFSGGSAFNSLAHPLRALTRNTLYVLPVTDDGGSTAEIRRVKICDYCANSNSEHLLVFN